MLKFKSRKASVPALLTLGLVLVGSLVTIGISYLTSTNKIASNPRADASCTPTEGPNQAICFCNSSNQAVIYASWDARVANCMTAPISNYINAQSYGTDKWGYCDSTADFQPTCGSGGGGGGGGGGVTPEGCVNNSCRGLSFGNSDHDVSYYEEKPTEYYFDKNCNGDPVSRAIIQDEEHCLKAVQGDCTETPCGNFNTQLKGMDNYDKEFAKSHTVYTKTGDPKFYDGKPCDELNEITLAEACIPPASETHTCTIEVQCSDILGSDYTGKLFQWSDAQGSGENYYKTNSCLSEADPDEDCTLVTAAPPPPASSWHVVGQNVQYGGVTYVNCLAEGCGESMTKFQTRCANLGGRYVIVNNTGCTGRYCCDPNVP